MRYRSLPILALLLGLAGLSSPCLAALGGGPDSVQADTLKMVATRKVAVKTLYQVHLLQTASGTVVREYVSSTGAVFAVVWRGPFKPDLHQLLGAYFDRFVAAGALAHPDHRLLRMAEPDVVIESAGRMRAFVGRGVVPGMMPSGVSLDEIQ